MSELFGVVDRVGLALDYHLARHVVLSSNVANVDTPGFRPVDLLREPEGPTRDGPVLPLAQTSTGHLAPREIAGPEIRIVEDVTVSPGGDGNAVSLERELAKIAANDLRYEGAAQIVARRLALLRYAASDAMGG